MESLDTRTCREVINHLLLDPRNGNESLDTLGFMVHCSIFDQFCAILSQNRVAIDEELIWDYTLYIEHDFFMMKLIHVTPANEDQKLFLSTIIEHAKVSFYWEDSVSLYTTTEHYHFLKTFINEKNLKKSIRRTYTKLSISCSHAELNVVEFDESVPRDIIAEFYASHKSHPDSMYYVTYALDYLEPKNLEHFNKPYTNPDTLLILYLILDYHRSCKRKKIREVFNIVDLCAMKLAFDDPRYEYENCEFEKLIKVLLNSKKYVKSGTFNMKLYVINKGVYKLPHPSVVTYLISNYQADFNKIEYFEKFKGFHIKQNFIRLADIIDPLNLITFLEHNEKSELYFIDGTNFTEWTGTLFIKLCEQGARRMIIDTTGAEWRDCDAIQQSLEFIRDDYVKSIEIIGTNEFYFIENFFNWLKLNFGNTTKYFNVTFTGCPIEYPFIFNRLAIGNIVFDNLTLTKRLLDNIARCQYNDIMTISCKLENNVEVIGCLDRLERILLQITLQEESHTLPLFMQFIDEYMVARNLREFAFRNKIFIITNAFLNFDEYKFIMNEDCSRLDFYHKASGEVVDIYAHRFRNHIGEDDTFDFYQ